MKNTEQEFEELEKLVKQKPQWDLLSKREQRFLMLDNIRSIELNSLENAELYTDLLGMVLAYTD